MMGAKQSFAKLTDSKTFDREAIFATQQLTKNDFSMKVANQNPMSVRLAMLNLAGIGLTLNPANAYAYLVPRDGHIVVDISYKGLIKVATDTGSISWARADMVYEKDSFQYNGPAAAPIHQANPFSERGEIIGVYCIAKTHDGDILTEVMGIEELYKIRDASPAWKKSQSGVWASWFEQMAKKSVIKRASKTWPYTDRIDRLNDAIELANNSEGGYLLNDAVSRHAPPAPQGEDVDAAHNEAIEAAKHGVEHFRAFWNDWSKEKRLLVKHRIDEYKKAAEDADAKEIEVVEVEEVAE